MTDKLLVELYRSIDALTVGFSEPIEYVVEVNGVREARRVMRRYDALLSQLEAAGVEPLQSRAPGPGGGGKPGSRPPINEAYVNCIERIHEGAQDVWAVLNSEGARYHGPLAHLLVSIKICVGSHAEEYAWHDRTVTAWREARSWVHDARVLLGYESRKTTLADTVCGQCGGTLVVAVDATSDVRCIGTQDSDPCGMVYGRLDWVSLLG